MNELLREQNELLKGISYQLEELVSYLVPSREAAPLPAVLPDNLIILPKRVEEDPEPPLIA